VYPVMCRTGIPRSVQGAYYPGGVYRAIPQGVVYWAIPQGGVWPTVYLRVVYGPPVYLRVWYMPAMVLRVWYMPAMVLRVVYVHNSVPQGGVCAQQCASGCVTGLVHRENGPDSSSCYSLGCLTLLLYSCHI